MRISQTLMEFNDGNAFGGAWSISTANLFGEKKNN